MLFCIQIVEDNGHNGHRLVHSHDVIVPIDRILISLQNDQLCCCESLYSSDSVGYQELHFKVEYPTASEWIMQKTENIIVNFEPREENGLGNTEQGSFQLFSVLSVSAENCTIRFSNILRYCKLEK